VIPYPFIAIEGNIGAGKSTLAARLLEAMQAVPVNERFENNPLLPLFYKNPERYAFPVELSFLEDRFRQLTEELPSGKNIVSDYFYAKSLVFAQVNLQGEELALFKRYYRIMEQQMRLPDLVIYLHREVDGLKDNITSRGRSYEQQISDDYLVRITQGYQAFFRSENRFPVLWVDTQQLTGEGATGRILEEIQKRLPNGITRLP
jgi:deoxyadenosine/deoxycytidine kinase